MAFCPNRSRAPGDVCPFRIRTGWVGGLELGGGAGVTVFEGTVFEGTVFEGAVVEGAVVEVTDDGGSTRGVGVPVAPVAGPPPQAVDIAATPTATSTSTRCRFLTHLRVGNRLHSGGLLSGSCLLGRGGRVRPVNGVRKRSQISREREKMLSVERLLNYSMPA